MFNTPEILTRGSSFERFFVIKLKYILLLFILILFFFFYHSATAQYLLLASFRLQDM